MTRGPLFRLFGLERHLCPSCYRDNIHRVWRRRPGATRLRQCPARCRWCGGSMVNWAAMTACVQSLASAMGHTFQAAADAAMRAMNAYALAMTGTTWTVDLKEGRTATRVSRVQVLAPDETEAKLVACQMAARPGRVPTRATIRGPEEVRAEEGARQITQAYRLDNPIVSAVELRRDVP